MAIQPGVYRHFKGNEYLLLGEARHSETLEPMVVYRALYGDGSLWVRPAAMWEELVERADYITHFQKEKHPYDRGVPARCGVEF